MAVLLAQFIEFVINIVIFLIFAQVIVHWLIIFEVLKVNNFQARHLVQSLNNFTERLYRPFRRYIPLIAGLDLTPLVVIFALQIFQSLIFTVLVR